MMMIPKRKNEFNFWDDMFKDPFFTGESNKLMKTDIKEKKDKYLINIDLPGYEKENIQIEVQDGYLTVHATSNIENDEGEGEYLRKERYFGECSRSFYVGDDVKEEEVKASFKNGTLNIEIPKKDKKEELQTKKYIPIE